MVRSRLKVVQRVSLYSANQKLDSDMFPLHVAALSRSMEDVRRLVVAYPPDRQSKASFSVTECAFGWPEGLGFLVRAGYDATDVFVEAVHTSDLETIELILDGGFPLSCVSPRRSHARCWQRSSELCTNAVVSRMIVDALVERRSRLRDLAIQHLADRSDISTSVPLDSAAYSIFKALCEQGVDVPSELDPGPVPIYQSFNIACPPGGLLLASELYAAGFREVHVRHGRGETLLEEAIRAWQWPTDWHQSRESFNIGMLDWLVKMGLNPNFSRKNEEIYPNAFLLVRSEGYWLGSRDPCFQSLGILVPSRQFPTFRHRRTRKRNKRLRRVIGNVAAKCQVLTTDSCHCYCETNGCLPIHKISIFKRAVPYNSMVRTWGELRRALEDWISDCQLDEGQARVYFREGARQEVFHRLGMTHMLRRQKDGVRRLYSTDYPGGTREGNTGGRE